MNVEKAFKNETDVIAYYNAERMARKEFLAALHFHCLHAKLRRSLHCEKHFKSASKKLKIQEE